MLGRQDGVLPPQVGNLGTRQFASANLGMLSCVVLFSNSVNDASFRRRTKTDSNKTPFEVRARECGSGIGPWLVLSKRPTSRAARSWITEK